MADITMPGVQIKNECAMNGSSNGVGGVQPIPSLEGLTNELTRVLHNREDPDRLRKAKVILEAYQGNDWILHQSCPNQQGFQVCGYSRICVKDVTDLYSLLVLTWSPRSRSPIHDHPCKRCFLMPLQGNMYEEKYEVDITETGAISNPVLEARVPIPVKEASWIDNSHGWHSIENAGPGLSVSLHCYIPGYQQCKIVNTANKAIMEVACIPKPVATPFLHDIIFDKVKAFVSASHDPTAAPVVSYQKRNDIEATFEKHCPIAFFENALPVDDQALMKALDYTCDLSVQTGHLFFFNQLFARADPLSVSAEALSAALNCNMFNFENAPVMLLMERRLLQHMASFLGWYSYPAGAGGMHDPNSSQAANPLVLSKKYSGDQLDPFDGILLPGASLCNITALHIARHKLFPQILEEGIQVLNGKKLLIFTSDQSHCSMERGCMMLGMGRNACVTIPTDPDSCQMDVEALEAAIINAKNQGNIPFFINATCGTTVAGAFDDFSAISSIAQKHGCWMHCDGALGASFLLPTKDTRDDTHDSEPYIRLTRGMENADSVSWNLHKLLGCTLQCSALLTRHRGILVEAHEEIQTLQAAVMSHLDTHNSSLLCGRKSDALKAWILWKKLGDSGMANRVRLVYTHTQQFAVMLTSFPRKHDFDFPSDNPDFEKVDEGSPQDGNDKAFALAYKPMSACCCFYWVPYDLRKTFYGQGPAAVADKLTTVAMRMRAAMLHEGSMMISYYAQGPGGACFWRVPNINPDISLSDLWTLLRIINRIGNQCFPPGCSDNSYSDHAMPDLSNGLSKNMCCGLPSALAPSTAPVSRKEAKKNREREWHAPPEWNEYISQKQKEESLPDLLHI